MATITPSRRSERSDWTASARDDSKAEELLVEDVHVDFGAFRRNNAPRGSPSVPRDLTAAVPGAPDSRPVLRHGKAAPVAAKMRQGAPRLGGLGLGGVGLSSPKSPTPLSPSTSPTSPKFSPASYPPPSVKIKRKPPAKLDASESFATSSSSASSTPPLSPAPSLPLPPSGIPNARPFLSPEMVKPPKRLDAFALDRPQPSPMDRRDATPPVQVVAEASRPVDSTAALDLLSEITPPELLYRTAPAVEEAGEPLATGDRLENVHSRGEESATSPPSLVLPSVSRVPARDIERPLSVTSSPIDNTPLSTLILSIPSPAATPPILAQGVPPADPSSSSPSASCRDSEIEAVPRPSPTRKCSSPTSSIATLHSREEPPRSDGDDPLESLEVENYRGRRPSTSPTRSSSSRSRASSRNRGLPPPRPPRRRPASVVETEGKSSVGGAVGFPPAGPESSDLSTSDEKPSAALRTQGHLENPSRLSHPPSATPLSQNPPSSSPSSLPSPTSPSPTSQPTPPPHPKPGTLRISTAPARIPSPAPSPPLSSSSSATNLSGSIDLSFFFVKPRSSSELSPAARQLAPAPPSSELKHPSTLPDAKLPMSAGSRPSASTFSEPPSRITLSSLASPSSPSPPDDNLLARCDSAPSTPLPLPSQSPTHKKESATSTSGDSPPSPHATTYPPSLAATASQPLPVRELGSSTSALLDGTIVTVGAAVAGLVLSGGMLVGHEAWRGVSTLASVGWRSWRRASAPLVPAEEEVGGVVEEQSAEAERLDEREEQDVEGEADEGQGPSAAATESSVLANQGSEIGFQAAKELLPDLNDEDSAANQRMTDAAQKAAYELASIQHGEAVSPKIPHSTFLFPPSPENAPDPASRVAPAAPQLPASAVDVEVEVEPIAELLPHSRRLTSSVSGVKLGSTKGAAKRRSSILPSAGRLDVDVASQPMASRSPPSLLVKSSYDSLRPPSITSRSEFTISSTEKRRSGLFGAIWNGLSSPSPVPTRRRAQSMDSTSDSSHSITSSSPTPTPTVLHRRPPHATPPSWRSSTIISIEKETTSDFISYGSGRRRNSTNSGTSQSSGENTSTRAFDSPSFPSPARKSSLRRSRTAVLGRDVGPGFPETSGGVYSVRFANATGGLGLRSVAEDEAERAGGEGPPAKWVGVGRGRYGNMLLLSEEASEELYVRQVELIRKKWRGFGSQQRDWARVKID